ncbi:VIT1/CCC1 transporter family protein, partial [Candidatus Saccharibacteria bacterium]|nr:VIT1/CCC1 transporter family protein [Candidatus Saccharibacteria bacterium]
ELNIDPDNLTNPWQAAYASSSSFLVGALIPLGVIMLPLGSLTVAITFAAVVVALIITGFLSARAGGASIRTSIMRVVAGGVLAMAVTYTIGRFFNISGV